MTSSTSKPLEGHAILKLLPHEHARLVKQAIQSAQTAGELPDFDIPSYRSAATEKSPTG